MSEITDFGPRKTIFILAIVAGCFAVLWPKIFYPMLTASVNSHHSSSDGKFINDNLNDISMKINLSIGND